MQVKYIKDKEYDAYMIWGILHKDDPSGAENRAKIMGIELDLLKKIHGEEDYNKVKNLIEEVVDNKYKELGNEINETIEEYQKAWNEINGVFSNKIGNTMNMKWEHDTYYVVVSPFHPGISSKGYDKVIRYLFEDPKDQLRITAHEILMSNIWSTFYELYPEEECDEDKNKHLWALNEITTTAILGLEENINNLWTEDKKGYDKFLGNYPQLDELKMKLKELYLNKKDFNEYLTTAKELLDIEYKNIDLGYTGKK